jgi:hypothetical protein
VVAGAQDRASPNFMGLASLGLEIGIFCDSLYSDLLLNVFFGARFLRASPIPAGGGLRQVPRRARDAGGEIVR